MKLYIGIDLGGTNIKGILTDEEGNIFAEDEAKTQAIMGSYAVCDNIARLVNLLALGHEEEIFGVGIGCPGMIDKNSGVCVFAANLNFKALPLKEEIEKRCPYRVKISNDAKCAALGESMFGAGKDYKDSILITLGTGVGGGIIIDGKLFEGSMGIGAEIGHMVIKSGGRMCTCGRRGCFEAYCSATALKKDISLAMEKDRASLLWRHETPQSCTAKTAFDYMDKDDTARQVINEYIKNLSTGICNLANIFRPQVILLGGGVSKQGDRLTKPLQNLLDKEIFGGADFSPVKILTASLGNRAGAYGAAALVMEI